jgi:hypothetical protein
MSLVGAACTIDQGGMDAFPPAGTSAGADTDDAADDGDGSTGEDSDGGETTAGDDSSSETTGDDPGAGGDSGGDGGTTDTPCAQACAVIIDCDSNAPYTSIQECADECQSFADMASAGGAQCPAAVDALNECIGSLTCDAYAQGAMNPGSASDPCAAESAATMTACQDPGGGGGTTATCSAACDVIMACDPQAPYSSADECVGACEQAISAAQDQTCASSIESFNACISALDCGGYQQFASSMPGDQGVPCGAEGTQMLTVCQG